MKTQFSIKNLDCANCAVKIEDHLRTISGVKDVSVNFSTLTLHIDTDNIQSIHNEIKKIEPNVEIIPVNNTSEIKPFSISEQLFSFRFFSIIIATSLFVSLFFVGKLVPAESEKIAQYLLASIAYLLCGWSVLTKAFRTIISKQWFDENVLMTIATIGAFGIHAFEEAVGVMIFYQIGELLQNLAVRRSRSSIQKLLEIRPDFANVKSGSGLKRVSPDTVLPGDIIVVKAGEKVPLDSMVLSGKSQTNTSILTGESTPKMVTDGDIVLAGEINLSGMLTLKVLKKLSDCSITHILELVENAAEKKTKTENFITSFARYYTPSVVVISLLIALLPPLLFSGQLFSEWLYRALVLLVISCPCALIISIPLGYFGGIGGASRHGVLIKGSVFIDVLSKVQSVVFDKTGTLTEGVFTVQKVIPANGYTDNELLSFAALAEFHSNHPIAKSIVKSYTECGGAIEESSISSHYELSGYGVKAVSGLHSIVAGNDNFMQKEGISFSPCDYKSTVVHVGVDSTYAGCVIIGDTIKNDSFAAITQLRQQGIHDISILTGDNKTSAAIVANALQIDHCFSELLPEDKVKIFDDLATNKKHNGSIAFVGDGVNDTPVLARADVSIAMGAFGSDAAIETADVVLLTDHPSKLVHAIKIAKRTRTIVWQNIFMALGIKLLFVGLGSVGLASMWEAVFADIGVTVLAVLNASRSFVYKNIEA